MGLGKWLVVVGLSANILGALFVGYVLPRGATVTYGGAVPRPFTPLGRFADRVGWPLLGLGFLLQLVGTVLWT